MKIDLSGKTAIITGSTGGIGLAIARGLAHCGAAVVVNGLTSAAVEQAVAAVKATAPLAEVRGTAANLAVASGCTALVKTEPACDILVNKKRPRRLPTW
jgi:NAD(P)-dependent dehydrogenase (short-subunit alcohol dehydrogenase family)